VYEKTWDKYTNVPCILGDECLFGVGLLHVEIGSQIAEPEGSKGIPEY